MSDSKWGARARQVIDRVIRENEGKPAEEVLELIDAAYPFGERAHHPYKMWLGERRKARQRLGLLEAPKPAPYETIGNGPLFGGDEGPA